MRISGAEWTVMNVVWEIHPVTARQVFERVEPETGWAYDTVRTILNRLTQKRVLKSELRGNTAWFEPVLSRAEARLTALSWVAERAFGGAYGSLMHFLVTEKGLSPAEKEELRRLLSEEEES